MPASAGHGGGEVPDVPETQPRTLRESIERSWNEVVEQPEEASPAPELESVDKGAQPRDELGRFATREGYREPGEAAEPEKTPPSPETEIPQAEPATQPRQGVAAAAPENWS